MDGEWMGPYWTGGGKVVNVESSLCWYAVRVDYSASKGDQESQDDHEKSLNFESLDMHELRGRSGRKRETRFGMMTNSLVMITNLHINFKSQKGRD
jgi:hypothetical protein